MGKENTIAVNVEQKCEVSATGAYLYVEISGETFISGAEALKKLKRLVI